MRNSDKDRERKERGEKLSGNEDSFEHVRKSGQV